MKPAKKSRVVAYAGSTAPATSTEGEMAPASRVREMATHMDTQYTSQNSRKEPPSLRARQVPGPRRGWCGS